MDKRKKPSQKLKNLDLEASQIGMRGKVSPETNEIRYQERMQHY